MVFNNQQVQNIKKTMTARFQVNACTGIDRMPGWKQTGYPVGHEKAKELLKIKKSKNIIISPICTSLVSSGTGHCTAGLLSIRAEKHIRSIPIYTGWLKETDENLIWRLHLLVNSWIVSKVDNLKYICICREFFPFEIPDSPLLHPLFHLLCTPDHMRTLKRQDEITWAHCGGCRRPRCRHRRERTGPARPPSWSAAVASTPGCSSQPRYRLDRTFPQICTASA